MSNPARRAAASRAARPLALLALATLGACSQDPVEWAPADRRLAVAIPTAERAVAAPDAAADSILAAALPGEAAGAASVASLPADPLGQPCPTSVRVAAGRAAERVAVWWSLRADRSTALLASRSTDGGATWDAAARVDTLDRSEAGCDRPAPSVAVDTVNGFVHVAYSLAAPEGKGVFYAHRMDPRAPFEPPQVIVYGDRPAATSVVSDGDRVLVAYEDPNTGGRPFISLALSRTAGHTWAERFAASEGSMSAERPRVRLRAREVVLGWVERNAPRELATTDDPRSATTPYPTGVVVRTGRLRE